MKRFWRGFSKEAEKNSSKKIVLVVFWSSEKNQPNTTISSTKFKYPTIKVRTIDVSRDPLSLKKHSIKKLPTVVLLKNGREIDRLEDMNKTLVEDIFRRAIT